MILGYRNKQTETFAMGNRIPAFESFRRQAEMRLDRLEAALNLLALRGFAGNRLEALKGKRKGQHSIRINDQWRICFEWPEGASRPDEVEIVDYHD
jgi:proteic killer suppression protein